ncbi:hypothetical protein [Bradyrhizobium sp. BR 1432]|uniref:hypothetical protein n=1 Tax=Bradyrhizobium sp. BR 1432 TaxID=3447966 RepID=UPI003EE613A8
MAMLVRAGLPSRIAAREAIEQTQPIFSNLSEMNSWLESNEVIALTDQPNFPTPETSAIWKQFRTEALSSPIQRWNEQRWTLELAPPTWFNAKLPARVYVDELTGRVSITSPDYREIVGVKQKLSNPIPALMQVNFEANANTVTIKRLGRGKASWHSS